jgi:hypothetical protein
MGDHFPNDYDEIGSFLGTTLLPDALGKRSNKSGAADPTISLIKQTYPGC